MSSAGNKAKARAEAMELARHLVDQLHNAEDPIAHLAEQLYPLIRARSAATTSADEAHAARKSLERRVAFLLKAGAVVHDQLLQVVAQRDMWMRETVSARRAFNELAGRSSAFSAWLLRIFTSARQQEGA